MTRTFFGIATERTRTIKMPIHDADTAPRPGSRGPASPAPPRPSPSSSSSSSWSRSRCYDAEEFGHWPQSELIKNLDPKMQSLIERGCDEPPPDPVLLLQPNTIDLDEITRFLRAARQGGQIQADLDLERVYPRVWAWFRALRSASETEATVALDRLVQLAAWTPGPLAPLDAVWAALLAATCADVDPPMDPPELAPFPPDWTFIPRLNHWDFDRILYYPFLRLSKMAAFQPDLELKPGLTCLAWLQSLVRHLLEQHDPLPQTSHLADFFGVLTRIHPQALEPHSGTISAWFIYNNEGLDARSLIRDVLDSARKTRQVPKYVSKLILAMLEHREILKFPAAHPLVLDELNAVYPKLPYGQLLDIGRTFNYHYEHDLPALKTPPEPVQTALDDLMASFFKHIPVLDHQVPRPILDKVVKMVHQTADIMRDFTLRCDHGLSRTPLALVSLAVHLMHYRDIPFLNVITTEIAKDVESRYADEYPFLAQQMYSLIPGGQPRMGPKSWPYPAVSMSCLKSLPRDYQFEHIVQSIRTHLSTEHLRNFPGVFEEDARLQSALIMAIIIDLADKLDVDETCSNVLRPLVQDNLRLLLDFEDPNHPELQKVIAKSFKVLDKSLISDISNPNLDYHYFKVPLTVMKELDLRNLHPTMKSLAFIVNYLLSAVSCYYEATITTIVNLRLICDVFTTPFEGFDHANGLTLLWRCNRFKMLGLELETPIWENFARIVKFYVNRIHLYVDKFPDTLELFRKYWASVHSEGDYRQHRVFAIFMDEIAKPILHGDATHPEKARICQDLFAQGKSKLYDVLQVAFREKHNTLIQQIAATLLGVHAKLKDTSIHRHDKSKTLQTILEWALGKKMTPPARLLTTLFKNLNFYRDHLPKQFDEAVFRVFAKMQVQFPHSRGPNVCNCQIESPKNYRDTVVSFFENVEDCKLRELTKDKNASLCQIFRIWQCFMRARKSQGLIEFGRPILEDHLLTFYKTTLEVKRGPMVMEHLILFYEEISKTDEPIVGSHLEANFLHLVGNSFNNSDLESHWTEINQVLSNLVQRRYFRVIQSRIPMFMMAMDNLIKGVKVKEEGYDKNRFPDPETNTAYRAREIDRTLSLLRNHKDDLARVVVHLLPRLLDTLSKVISHVPSKKAMNLAIYNVLDLCDEHSVSFLLGNLGPDLLELGRLVIQDHKAFHRYKGTV